MADVAVDDLVRWAWTDELVKVPPEAGVYRAPALLGYGNQWSGMIGAGSSARSGAPNRYGAVHVGDVAEPHPDALAVAEAVAWLDDLVVGDVDRVDFFGSWRDLGRHGEKALAAAWDQVTRADGPHRGAARVVMGLASSLVVVAACSGRWPTWYGEPPRLVLDVAPNGKPLWARLVERPVEWDDAGGVIRSEVVEVDGMDRRSGRPYPNAYRLCRLAPDPTSVLAERIRWAMLHAWMTALAARLDGLGGRRVLPPDRDPAPWAD